MKNQKYMSATKRWLDEIVIGLNLCPFAKHAVESIEFLVSEAQDQEQLLVDLEQACLTLNSDASIETLLLIHPNVLQEFSAYNQFLSYADALLEVMQLDGEIQVASFHPHYQFAETDIDSAENFTNRSPYPMLHLLREESVARAVETYPDVDAIPQRNIQTMHKQGSVKLQTTLSAIQASTEY